MKKTTIKQTISISSSQLLTNMHIKTISTHPELKLSKQQLLDWIINWFYEHAFEKNIRKIYLGNINPIHQLESLLKKYRSNKNQIIDSSGLSKEISLINSQLQKKQKNTKAQGENL